MGSLQSFFRIVFSCAFKRMGDLLKGKQTTMTTDKYWQKNKAFEKVVCFQDSSCWIIVDNWYIENFEGTILHTNFAGHILKNVSYYQTKTIKQMKQNHSLFGWAKLTFFPKQKYHIQPSFACSSAFFSSSESALSPPHSSWDDRDQHGDLRMEFRKNVDIPRLYMIYDIIYIIMLYSYSIQLQLAPFPECWWLHLYIYIIWLIYVYIILYIYM